MTPETARTIRHKLGELIQFVREVKQDSPVFETSLQNFLTKLLYADDSAAEIEHKLRDIEGDLAMGRLSPNDQVDRPEPEEPKDWIEKAAMSVPMPRQRKR